MFKLEIRTGNAAFSDDREEEIIRILQKVVDRMRNGSTGGRILDSNGNHVGDFDITED